MVGHILLAWIYSHLLEYCLHRFVLHDPKRGRGIFFKHHFSEHHRSARQLNMKDPKYLNRGLGLFFHYEVSTLSLLALLHIPVLFFSPVAYLTLVVASVCYFAVHVLQHRYPSVMCKITPWHYWHHMGKDQHLNYGVRLPVFDILFGTYKPVTER